MPHIHAYEEVADDLRKQISDGALLPGDRIPSQDELSARHGVSRTTVRKALGVLEHAGLTKGGRGTPAIVRATEVEVAKSRDTANAVDLDAVRTEVIEIHKMVRDLDARLSELRKRLS